MISRPMTLWNTNPTTARTERAPRIGAAAGGSDAVTERLFGLALPRHLSQLRIASLQRCADHRAHLPAVRRGAARAAAGRAADGAQARERRRRARPSPGGVPGAGGVSG